VIFDWIIHQESIFDLILGPLHDLNFDLHKVTLFCAPEALQIRMRQDHRDPAVIAKSLQRLRLYEMMDTTKIDTTHLTVAEVVRKIIETISFERVKLRH
jgi:hypothetical protein